MLLLKLLLTPLFILIVTLIGRRWGTLVSGLLVGLPLTSAPVSLFLAIEQGTTFASRAALGTMTGTISVAAFCLVYSWLSLGLPWPICLLSGWAVFFASTFLLEQFTLPLLPSFLLVLLVLSIVLPSLPAHALPPLCQHRRRLHPRLFGSGRRPSGPPWRRHRHLRLHRLLSYSLWLDRKSRYRRHLCPGHPGSLPRPGKLPLALKPERQVQNKKKLNISREIVELKYSGEM